jgi:hypothetical protein
MTSLYYDFSYLVSKERLHIHIGEEGFIFEEAKEVYVFTMAFISYPIYSHDFSYISSNIILHKFTEDGMIKKVLVKGDFPNCNRL